MLKYQLKWLQLGEKLIFFLMQRPLQICIHVQRGPQTMKQDGLETKINVQTFPSAGFLWLFYQYSYNRSTSMLSISIFIQQKYLYALDINIHTPELPLCFEYQYSYNRSTSMLRI